MHECEYALVRSSKALEAALMIQAAAIPLIWVPSVISPFPLRLPQRPPRRLSPLFFDHRNFFVVPFGQVDCGCGGKFLDVDYATGYWVFLFFVRHPAACGGWTLE